MVRGLARKDSRVRCIRRIGRRGLSGACIEGILASSGPYAAVIDADLQHDETQLPKMVALLRSGEAELVVGSRYIEGGSADSFNKQRAGASQLATEVARRALKVEVADPMSGFFMIRRDRFEQLAPQLSTQGFKILLDVIATAQGKLRTVEIPYTFGSRQHGESKLNSMVALDFLGLVLAKLTTTWCRCVSCCSRWSGAPALSCISRRCSSRMKSSRSRLRRRRPPARWLR